MKARAVPLGLALLLALAPLSARAFRFVPFTAEFDPAGADANQTFKVENNSKERIAVEIGVYRRAMNLDGSDELSSAEDDFVVFPAQVVLEPEKSQVVRVQWIGDPKPERELAYRIVAEQLPVDLEPAEGTGGSVRILVRYMGSIYVRSPGAEPDVVLESAEPAESDQGERQLAITLRNRGRAHAILRNLELSLVGEADSDGDPASLTLPSEELEGMSGENILADQSRRFVLPWPAKLAFDPVDVTFQFDGAAGRP